MEDVLEMLDQPLPNIIKPDQPYILPNQLCYLTFILLMIPQSLKFLKV